VEAEVGEVEGADDVGGRQRIRREDVALHEFDTCGLVGVEAGKVVFASPGERFRVDVDADRAVLAVGFDPGARERSRRAEILAHAPRRAAELLAVDAREQAGVLGRVLYGFLIERVFVGELRLLDGARGRVLLPLLLVAFALRVAALRHGRPPRAIGAEASVRSRLLPKPPRARRASLDVSGALRPPRARRGGR